MFENYILSSCFMVIVLALLAQKVIRSFQPSRNRNMCMLLILTVLVYVVMDGMFAACFLFENVNTVFFNIIVFLFFIAYVLMPYVWHVFIRNFVGCAVKKRLQIMEAVPVMILLFMIVLNPFTGILWHIDSSGNYTRGVVFQLFTLLNLFYYLEALVEAAYIFLSNRFRKKFPYLKQSVLITLIPFVAIVANTYFIPLSITYPVQPFCLVIVTMMSFFFIVDRENELQENMYRMELQMALNKAQIAREEAVQAGNVKTTFLANMSHDIRTPLNAILGYSKVIANHPDDRDKVSHAIEKIQVSGDVLLSLVNDVLDYSKIESGMVSLHEEPTDLVKLTDNICTMFAQQMEDRGLQFEVHTEHIEHTVLCDAPKLQQILVNILGNAMKYTPSGGKVTFTVRRTEGNRYSFMVEDTGAGISKKFQAHMFDAFEREDSSTNIRVSGTGLGLAIVKRLTDMMHGTVRVESDAGLGTKMTVVLDLAETEKTFSVNCQNRKYTRLDGVRILIAEDNELNSELERMLLNERGAETFIVKDGKQAVDAFIQNPSGTYDLILMDMMMPVMDGLEATRKIRSYDRSDATEIPIIGLTANAFREDAERCMEAGMNAHISKPIQIDEVVNTIGFYVYEKRD